MLVIILIVILWVILVAVSAHYDNFPAAAVGTIVCIFTGLFFANEGTPWTDPNSRVIECVVQETESGRLYVEYDEEMDLLNEFNVDPDKYRTIEPGSIVYIELAEPITNTWNITHGFTKIHLTNPNGEQAASDPGDKVQ